jgi:site-specific recombinase XerD
MRRNREKWNIENGDVITPYSFRYAIASTCFVKNIDKEKTAQILGHFDVRSQSYYQNRNSLFVHSEIPNSAKNMIAD